LAAAARRIAMLSAQTQPDVRSFYHLSGVDLSQARCQGTACFAARHRNPRRWSEALASPARAYCLGKCYAAPAAAEDDVRPIIQVRSRTGVVLERIAAGGARSLYEYRCHGGLYALEKALTQTPDQTISQIEASELRGRGGAGFPTGAKWRVAARQSAREKHVVANLDEGDPGAYIDRFLAEDDPFCLIEGMAVAAWAVGAGKGWIYVRCEYPDVVRSLHRALGEARSAGLLGSRVLGRHFSFDIELVVGQGSYLCGEETSLLNSIEGVRPVARARPPYVAERGLWGMPTVVNNVETLCNVPWIMRHGPAAFASLGIQRSRGTKVVSLNSLFRRPGLYEIDFGVSLRQIVEEIGGGLAGDQLKCLLIGGPLAGVIPPPLLDTVFGFDELRAIGASVGHGGIVAFDQRTSIAELVHHVFSFGAYESCGKCTPCRLGSARIEEIFRGQGGPAGQASAASRRAGWQEIVPALKLASLCGLGTGLAEFAESIERHFPEELQACLT
jgi:NADH:ubiquinone oxidoreductase subunit F (NADH-binding)